MMDGSHAGEGHNHDNGGGGGDGRMTNDPEWDEERRLYRKVLKTLGSYRGHAKWKLKSTLTFVESLPLRHQELLSQYKEHLRSFSTCIDVNQKFFQMILESVGDVYENQSQIYGPMDDNNLSPLNPTPSDYDKLNSILKQVVRDWSSEGFQERAACYQPIIDEIELQFGNVENKEDIHILVPGAGAGRLPHEIVRKGYATQGNEFSMYMLFASNFILNKCGGPNLHTCYPWLGESINVLHHHHQIRPLVFPDIDPSSLPRGARFSMTAGDFLDVYGTEGNQNAWDCIATCFFIDCATNIVAFLERIYGCLKENGVWINLGPLLYHYADLPDEKSIEPSYDFLISMVKSIGFKLEKEKLNVPTQFAPNRYSMLNYSYNSVFFVCRKTASNNSTGIQSGVEQYSLRESDSLQNSKMDDGFLNGNPNQ